MNGGESLKPTNVEAINNKNWEKEIIPLVVDDSVTSSTDKQTHKTYKMLYVKDRFRISNKAYHEMARVCPEMPHAHALKLQVGELNSPIGDITITYWCTTRNRIFTSRKVETFNCQLHT